MMEQNIPEYIAVIGSTVAGFWENHGKKHGIPVITGNGYPCLAHFSFEHELAAELRTLYTQLMLERGFLAGTNIYPTFAHCNDVVELYGDAVDEVFAEIRNALKADDVKTRLKGPVAHSGFTRLN